MPTVAKYYQNISSVAYAVHLWVQKRGFLVGLCLLLLYFLPYLVLGERAYFVILDNLDSNVAWFAVLKDSGLAFSFDNLAYMDQIMGGSVPRNAMPPAFNLVTLLFVLFDEPFGAFITNFFLSHLLAFVGMFLLLNAYVFKQKHQIFSALVALIFSFLPFYDIYGGGSVSGLPLCTYAFVNLYLERKRHFSCILLACLGFYTSLVLSSFFVCVLALLSFVYFYTLHKRFNVGLLLGLVIFSTANVIAEINLFILTFLPSDFISHRHSFDPSLASTSLGGVVMTFKSLFYEGQFHSPSFHYIILLLGCFYLLYLAINKKLKHPVVLLFLCLFIFNLAAALWDWEKIGLIKEMVVPLKLFNFNRITFLSSTLWYLLLAFIIRDLVKVDRIGLVLAYALLGVQTFIVVKNNPEFKLTLKLFVSNDPPEITPQRYPALSFEEFYAEDVFDNVKARIGEDTSNFYVVSVGVYPNVAQYNGLKTLDSYQPNYDLRYKQSFRTLIAEELEESDRLESYFDDWGSRCYVFSSELNGYYVLENPGIEDLDLDIQKFRSMKGKYVLSAVPLLNYEALDLQFLGEVRGESPLVIYLYKA